MRSSWSLASGIHKRQGWRGAFSPGNQVRSGLTIRRKSRARGLVNSVGAEHNTLIYLDHLIAATNGLLAYVGKQTRFEAFSHDTRQLLPGEMFVAVRGGHGGGDDFLLGGARRGAGGGLWGGDFFGGPPGGAPQGIGGCRGAVGGGGGKRPGP